ncbi:hypothetical protein ZWY2020_032496 [Hordeum vulgare]|nr:hypothetical protein ZWY2020_032496 [Hordeum vulgare]
MTENDGTLGLDVTISKLIEAMDTNVLGKRYAADSGLAAICNKDDIPQVAGGVMVPADNTTNKVDIFVRGENGSFTPMGTPQKNANKKKLKGVDGEARLFASTGVFIDSNGFTTRVLTSGSLIEVHLPDKRHVTGILQHYDLHNNVAVVIIEKRRCTRTASINNKVKTGTHSEVLAIGRVYESGKLLAASGIVINKESELNCKHLRISTCQITKAGIGGPLIDSDGNFIGMNFYGSEETPYMPRDIIVELLEDFDAKGWPVPKPYWCYPAWHERKEGTDLLEFFDQEFRYD